MRKIQNEIMEEARSISKMSGEKFDENLQKVQALHDLVERMEKGIVQFRFRRLDGKVRSVYGTLNPRHLPKSTGAGRRAVNENIQVYFDMQKGRYGSFYKSNLLI